MTKTIIIESVNSRAISKLKEKDYLGVCVGLANGKVVVKDKSIEKVMRILFTEHKGEEVAATSFPSKDKTLVI